MFTPRFMIAFFGDNWAAIKRGVRITDVTRGEEFADVYRRQWSERFGGRMGVSVGEALTFACSRDCSEAMAVAVVSACREGV